MKSFLVIAVFSFCWFLTESSQCNHPPRLWCSSREIARACQVESQCEASDWSDWGASAPKVNFSLYYEVECLGCQMIITDQLYPTFSKVSSIMNVELVPYGNADETKVGDKWVFDCQHGPLECLGNQIQTCAIHIFDNITKTLTFVDCMENSTATSDISGPQCAKQLGIDYEPILTCVNSSVGNELEHEMGVKTENLNPAHTYTPWVVLNGVHTEDIQGKAESALLKLICDTYTGTKPDPCSQENTVN